MAETDLAETDCCTAALFGQHHPTHTDLKKLSNKLCRPLLGVDQVVIQSSEKEDKTAPTAVRKFMLWRTMVLLWVLILSLPIGVDNCITLVQRITELINRPSACDCFPNCPVTMEYVNGSFLTVPASKGPQQKLISQAGSTYTYESWQECQPNHQRHWGTCTQDSIAEDDASKNCSINQLPMMPVAHQPCCNEDEFEKEIETTPEKRAYYIGVVLVKVLLFLLTVFFLAKAVEDKESSFGSQTTKHWPRSSKFVFASWLLPFLTTFIICLIPTYTVTKFDPEQLTERYASILDEYLINSELITLKPQFVTLFRKVLIDAIRPMLSMYMMLYTRLQLAIYAGMDVVPLALALLPGIRRGAFQIKMTLPSHALFGWISWCTPIFYVPLVAVVMVLVLQLFSSAWLSVATVLFSAGQLSPLLFGSKITKAYMDAQSCRIAARVSTVTRVKNTLLFLSALCFAVAADILLRSSPAQSSLMGVLKDIFNPRKAILISISVVRSYFLTIVVAADALLRLAFAMRAEDKKSDSGSNSDEAYTVLDAAKEAMLVEVGSSALQTALVDSDQNDGIAMVRVGGGGAVGSGSLDSTSNSTSTSVARAPDMTVAL